MGRRDRVWDVGMWLGGFGCDYVTLLLFPWALMGVGVVAWAGYWVGGGRGGLDLITLFSVDPLGSILQGKLY